MILTYLNLIIILGIIAVAPLSVSAQGKGIFMHDDFNNLENWRPLKFPKINRYTQYSIVQKGQGSYLKAESNASASGIVFKSVFSIFEYPKIRWRWKISNTYANGDATVKSGDDYALRVYVLFEYDPDKASLGKRLKYSIAKSIYGEYPPHSSLNYIWANKDHGKKIMTNPYSDEAKMVILQTGNNKAGRWIEEDVNIIEDYHKVFGEDPPPAASLAIMSDSDNTGESAVSYIDYIEIYR